MSDNWIVQNLQNALDTWNAKITEIWSLVLTSPKDFKGGGIWTAIENVNSAVQAIGLALLVLFFVIGVVKTCGSFAEVKKPEHAVKLFVRFILAKAVITNGMELMLTLFNIVQSTIGTIMTSAGLETATQTVLPDEGNSNNENCGFLGEYSAMGGNAYRRIVHYRNVFHYDIDRVRKIFQALYVHGACSHTAFNLCRRAYAECR